MSMHAFNGPLERPLPVPDLDTQPFWDALKEHRLTIQECSACHLRRFPPIGTCPRCHGWEATWVEIHGGVVHSWTVVTHGVTTALKQQVPYIVGLIDVGEDNDESVQMPANIVGIEAKDLRADMPVKVQFQELAGGYTIPVFAPQEA